jgi:hypothetical protein
MKYVICTIAGDNTFEVHKAGCQDIQRGLTLVRKYHGGHPEGKCKTRQYVDCIEYEASSAREAVREDIEELNADFGKGVWDESSFFIAPCAKNKK